MKPPISAVMAAVTPRSRKAEGSADGHCSCVKLCPMQRIAGFIRA
jgi:hypothetical protein